MKETNSNPAAPNIRYRVPMTTPFFSLANRVALVTGGGQGIGAATLRRLATAGAKVAVLDLNVELAQAAAESGGIGLGQVDVTSETDLARVQQEIESRLGPIDLLVNAGITGKAGRIGNRAHDLESVMNINVTGSWLCCRLLLPACWPQFGRIVNIASIAGKEGNPTRPLLCQQSRTHRPDQIRWPRKLRARDITINAISPAVIATPILDGLPQSTVDYMVSRIPMAASAGRRKWQALVHYLAVPRRRVSPPASATTSAAAGRLMTAHNHHRPNAKTGISGHSDCAESGSL